MYIRPLYFREHTHSVNEDVWFHLQQSDVVLDEVSISVLLPPPLSSFISFSVCAPVRVDVLHFVWEVSESDLF